LAQAKRVRVSDLLKRHKEQWEKQISEQSIPTKPTPSPAAEPIPAPISKVAAPTSVSYVEPTDYYWDEDKSTVNITMPIPGAQQLDAANIQSTFGTKEATITIHGPKNYRKTFRNLHEAIVPETSSHVVRKDKVVLKLKKKNQRDWGTLFVSAKKKPETKPEGAGDPSKGIMDLMKNLYDEGDDDMKRNIAKAWTESRDKKDPLGQGLGGMDSFGKGLGGMDSFGKGLDEMDF